MPVGSGLVAGQRARGGAGSQNYANQDPIASKVGKYDPLIGASANVASKLMDSVGDFGSYNTKRDYKGFNYLNNSPLASNYGAYGANTNQSIANLLGQGGDPAAQQAAFQNYLNSTGYQFQQAQGQRAVTGAQSAGGLLNSGATLKALQQRGQDIAGGAFQNYLNNLGNLSKSGQEAYGTIGQAATVGGTSAATNAQQNKKGNLDLGSSIFGSVMKMFSDARLKSNLVLVNEDDHGQRWYRYNYTPEARAAFDLPDTPQYGVVAQEVLLTDKADAVSIKDGFYRVDYSLLEA